VSVAARDDPTRRRRCRAPPRRRLLLPDHARKSVAGRSV